MKSWASEDIDLDWGLLAHSLGFNLRRLQMRHQDMVQQSLQPWGLTPARFAALTLIGRNPGIKLVQLAQALGVAKSGAMVLVDALEAAGHVHRVPSTQDRRAVLLHLTEQGQREWPRLESAVLQQAQHLRKALSTEEWATLVNLLRRLHQSEPWPEALDMTDTVDVPDLASHTSRKHP